MAQPAPPKKNRHNSSQRNYRAEDPAETVSGRWLVRAILLTLLFAAAALYCTVCLLFYQGQWQFIFFPPKQTANRLQAVRKIATRSGLPITDVRFDYTEEGMAQLNGWWVPATARSAANGGAASTRTGDLSSKVVLFCPNGRTTLSDNVAALQAFHRLGVSVFAFDYQGFGASQQGHPSQEKAYADGDAALRYLISTRHIDSRQVVIYGEAVGAAVAVHTALASAPIGGIILANPRPSYLQEVKREQHVHVLPLWLIFPDRLEIDRQIAKLSIPKLILLIAPTRQSLSWKAQDAQTVYQHAALPRSMEIIPTAPGTSEYAQPQWQQAIQNFVAGLH